MKKIVSLVLLTGMLTLMSFGNHNEQIKKSDYDCMAFAIDFAVNHPELDYLWVRGMAYDICSEVYNQC